MAGTLNGFTIGYTVTGVILLYSGIQGTTISDTFQSFLSGKTPAAGTETIDTSAVPESGAPTAASSATAPASGNYTTAELESLWTSNGGSSGTAFVAAQVALAESSGDPDATSANPDGGTNVGLWQLDTKGVGAGYSVAQLQSPSQNAAITVMASKNGSSWIYWADSVITNGIYTGPKS
jgi:hypothetical protein